MEILKSLNELIFPHRCISCGALGISICSQCRRGWNPHRYFTDIALSGSKTLRVISSVPYSDIAQKVLLAAKESHIRRADLLVSSAIAHSVENFLLTSHIEFLVPIPSRPSAVRVRGRQFIEEMSIESSARFSIPIIPLLRHTRRIRDQSGLDHNQRRNNLHGALVVESKDVMGKRALLIDDLVTTGATLAEAARALEYAGIRAVGAVTAAVALTTRITQSM